MLKYFCDKWAEHKAINIQGNVNISNNINIWSEPVKEKHSMKKPVMLIKKVLTFKEY